MDICNSPLDKFHYFKVVVNIILAESAENEAVGSISNALNRLETDFGIKLISHHLTRLVRDGANQNPMWRLFVLQLHPAWFDVVESKRKHVISTWDKSRSLNIKCPEICAGCGSIDFAEYACFTCNQSYCNKECQKMGPNFEHLGVVGENFLTRISRCRLAAASSNLLSSPSSRNSPPEQAT
jgi:hypothetical protein